MLTARSYLAFDKNALRHDMQPFAEMMKSRTWWLVLIAAGIGAPLAEECLFRGLLYGALRRTPFGFTGAAARHRRHVGGAARQLFDLRPGRDHAIGLYLALLRERTGTLLTPIVCHGAYNSLIVLVLAFAPDGSLVSREAESSGQNRD